MKTWLPATAAMRWRSIRWPAGQVAAGAATLSGTVIRTINNSPGVYIR